MITQLLFMVEVGKKWKNVKVSNKKLKKINKKFIIKKVYNYYGVIEQAGSIFFE